MPLRHVRSWAPLCALALVALSCKSTEKPSAPVDECASATGHASLPKAACVAGTRWQPGQKAFQDATSRWGLSALGVEGVRLNVVDLDNDGWPDLVVRKSGIGSDDFAGNKRRTWLLRNTHDGHFEDITEKSGFLQGRTLDATKGRPGEVMAFADVDNDGDLDGYTGVTTSDGKVSLGETSEIMLNDGHGHFTLGPADSAVRRAGEVDVPAGASFVDVDLDGKLDLWVPQHSWQKDGNSPLVLQNDSLFLGDGKGSFASSAAALGVVTEDWYTYSGVHIKGMNVAALDDARAHSRAWSAAACDLNGDGLPELLAASYGRAPNHLWQAQKGADGKVSYVNRSKDSGYAYDDEMRWNDNQNAACYCHDNPSHPGCEGAPQPLLDCNNTYWDPATDEHPFRLGGNSGATTCADLDNDGDMDLVTSEIKHWWAGENSDGAEVLVNSGEGDVRFTRPGRQSMGLEVPHGPSVDWDEGIMTNAAFDFDNDGWPDLYLGGSDYPGNRGLLYHQKSKLQFEPVSIADGIDMHRSHGIAVADFDRDGDLDVVVGHSLARCDLPDSDAPCYATGGVHFFENVSAPGNWLQVKLAGCSRTNAGAVGARVTVTAGGVTQTQDVGGGYGHYGAQQDQVLHFGLGSACEAKVTVRWPNGQLTTDTWTLPGGHRFRLKEGGDPVVDDK